MAAYKTLRRFFARSHNQPPVSKSDVLDTLLPTIKFVMKPNYQNYDAGFYDARKKCFRWPAISRRYFI